MQELLLESQEKAADLATVRSAYPHALHTSSPSPPHPRHRSYIRDLCKMKTHLQNLHPMPCALSPIPQTPKPKPKTCTYILSPNPYALRPIPPTAPPKLET